MKTLQKSMYVLMLFSAVFLTGCSKDDDSSEEGDGGQSGSDTELFTAKVDGADWSADTDLATLIGGSLVTNNGITVLSAQGSTNDGTFINFNIINYDGPGTYRVADGIDNMNIISYGELNGGNPVSWVANGVIAITGVIEPGEIVITSQNDTKVIGTFSFEGYDGTSETVKNVTQGQFEVVFDN
ncbi:MAG: DUF6252 family protein [Bacteroidota bacterium]